MQRIIWLIGLATASLLLISCGTVQVSRVDNLSLPDTPSPAPTRTDAPVRPSATPWSPLTELPVPTVIIDSGQGSGGLPTPAPILHQPTAETESPDEAPCAPRVDWPVHIVQWGETLGDIALWSGAAIRSLVEANCLVDADMLYAGQSLRVPRLPVTPEPSSPADETWTVFHSDKYDVTFSLPADWQPVGDDVIDRFVGQSGWLEISALGSPWSLGEVTANQANHKLSPFGSSPEIERLTLVDGRQARIIYPSADQPSGMDGRALLIAPYGAPLAIDEVDLNYFTLAADVAHIGPIARTLEMAPAPEGIDVHFFTVQAIDLEGGGKRLTFKWDSDGATRGIITVRSAERFVPWWAVEASGELIVDLEETHIPDPPVTLELFNSVSGATASEMLELAWPCSHETFFSSASQRCPEGPPLTVTGAYQPFENGFMIWLPVSDLTDPTIFVFANEGLARNFTDQYLAGLPNPETDLVPPEGLFLPIRGFGRVWREEPGLRELLGWATAPEWAYEVTFQREAEQGMPAVFYLRAPDGRVLRVTGIEWDVLLP